MVRDSRRSGHRQHDWDKALGEGKRYQSGLDCGILIHCTYIYLRYLAGYSEMTKIRHFSSHAFYMQVHGQGRRIT